jgi:hypothetical protein
MAILFSCDCGQQLAVRDENAGRHVRCTACNAVLTAPNGQPAHETETAPVDSSMVRFTCPGCNKAVQARAEFAGKQTRCPGCGLVVPIPQSSGEASPVAPRAPKPLPWHTGRDGGEAGSDRGRLSEEDFANEDRLRRRLKKKGASNDAKVWMFLVLFFLVLGAAYAGWKLFLNGGFGGRSNPLDYVPRNAVGFGSIHFGQIIRRENGNGKVEMANLRQEQRDQVRLIQNQTGINLLEVEELALVALDPQGEMAWMVVQLNKNVDQRVLTQTYHLSERMHEGKSYHASADDTVGLMLVDSKTFILGTAAGIKHCLDMPKTQESGPLDESVKMAASDKYQMVIAGTGEGIKALADQARMNMVWNKQSAFENARFVRLTAAGTNRFTMELTADFPDPEKARGGKEELDNLVSLGKGLQLLGAFGLGALKEQAPEADWETLLSLMDKLVNAVKIRQDGVKVSADLTITEPEMQKIMREHEGRANPAKPFPRPRRR